MTTLSLELSKELQSVCKEKHIEMPESYLSYFYQEITESVVRMATHIITLSEYLAPAYTLDELLEWLPRDIDIKNGYGANFLTITTFNQDEFIALYYGYSNEYFYPNNYQLKNCCTHDPNPCDACGKLLIWLIKENLL